MAATIISSVANDVAIKINEVGLNISIAVDVNVKDSSRPVTLTKAVTII